MGGRLWLWLVPCVLGFAAVSMVSAGPLAGPVNRDFGSFLGSVAGEAALAPFMDRIAPNGTGCSQSTGRQAERPPRTLRRCCYLSA